MITIHRDIASVEQVVCSIADDKAELKEELMGQHEVTIEVTVDTPLPVAVGDYVRIGEVIYTLNRPAECDKCSEVEYRYTLTFEHPQYTLLDKVYTYLLTGESVFSLTGTLSDFAELVASNINTIHHGWTVGACPDTERKNLSFESESCGDIPARIAKEFNMEYHIGDHTLSFYDRYEHPTSLVFEQGRGKGLYKLTQKNVDTDNTVTRAILYGGTKNLPQGYRSGSKYLRWSDASGHCYIEDTSEYSKIVERAVYFDDVYPKFEGSVEGVSGDNYTEIVCSMIDFDINNYLVPGTPAKINFLTGDLTGLSFELYYNHSTHKVSLVRQDSDPPISDDQGNIIQIPYASRKSSVGDRFNFTDIYMPAEYITAAEQALHDNGVEWLSRYKQLRVSYDIDVDHRLLRRRGESLSVGDIVQVKDAYLEIDRLLRVISTERNIHTGKVSCTVSNYLRYSREKDIETRISNVRSKIDASSEASTLEVSATKSWASRMFARMFGGNRFIGNQAVEGDVEVTGGVKAASSSVDGEASSKSLKANSAAITTLTSSSIETTVLKVLEQIIAKDARFSGKVSTPEFLSGLLGYGWCVDASGNAEMESLKLRTSLEVPTLIYNKVQVIGGEMWVTEGGEIASVERIGNTNQYTVTLKLQEGEVNPFAEGDILRGIYHKATGFTIIISRVDTVSESGAMIVTPRTVGVPPCRFMTIARQGSFTNPARQRSIMISSKEGRIQFLSGVNTWDLKAANTKMILGDTSGFIHPDFGDVSGYNAVIDNILMRGRIYQRSSDGETEQPVPVYKGEWVAGTYYYYDEVTLDGCRWMCVVESTSTRPAVDAPDWIKTVDKGEDAYSCVITSDAPMMAINGKVDLTLTCHVYRGETEVTSTIPANHYSWVRKSLNADTDAVWSELHESIGNVLHVTGDDVVRSALFECIVID